MLTVRLTSSGSIDFVAPHNVDYKIRQRPVKNEMLHCVKPKRAVRRCCFLYAGQFCGDRRQVPRGGGRGALFLIQRFALACHTGSAVARGGASLLSGKVGQRPLRSGGGRRISGAAETGSGFCRSRSRSGRAFRAFFGHDDGGGHAITLLVCRGGTIHGVLLRVAIVFDVLATSLVGTTAD